MNARLVPVSLPYDAPVDEFQPRTTWRCIGCDWSGVFGEHVCRKDSNTGGISGRISAYKEAPALDLGEQPGTVADTYKEGSTMRDRTAR